MTATMTANAALRGTLLSKPVSWYDLAAGRARTATGKNSVTPATAAATNAIAASKTSPVLPTLARKARDRTTTQSSPQTIFIRQPTQNIYAMS
ncbi:hypothetical protein AB0346_08865 [Nocardia beijingensis]|uniref:hypothetical protein n=1 Tax=Nocardia beijingensis TaxID=95162 RepID=UPI00344F3766